MSVLGSMIMKLGLYFLKCMIKVNALILALFLALPVLASGNKTSTELQKIETLLESVKNSNLTFIRNGKEYSAQEGHKHLEMKLKKARNSWFAPPQDKWTASMFIEKVASKSSLSGKPYKVRTKDGKTLNAENWLKEKLNEIESQNIK